MPDISPAPSRPRRPGAQRGRCLRRAPLNNLNALKHRLLHRQPAWPAPQNTSLTTKASGSPTDYFTPPLRRSARSSKKEGRKCIRFDLFFRGTNPPASSLAASAYPWGVTPLVRPQGWGRGRGLGPNVNPTPEFRVKLSLTFKRGIRRQTPISSRSRECE